MTLNYVKDDRLFKLAEHFLVYYQGKKRLEQKDRLPCMESYYEELAVRVQAEYQEYLKLREAVEHDFRHFPDVPGQIDAQLQEWIKLHNKRRYDEHTEHLQRDNLGCYYCIHNRVEPNEDGEIDLDRFCQKFKEMPPLFAPCKEYAPDPSP